MMRIRISLKTQLFWLVIFSMVILLAGCGSKEAALKEASGDKDRLNFSSETIAAGEKLPNLYQNKKFHYSIRYSDSWKARELEADGTAYWDIKESATSTIKSNFNVVILPKSDLVVRKMSDKAFMEIVSNSLKENGFSEIKVTGSLKSTKNEEVWFFFEYEAKIDGKMTYFQQYYFDNGKKVAILTNIFGTKEEQQKYTDEIRSGMSSLKILN